MDADTPRWEFRIFGPHLAAAARLAAVLPAAATAASEERYLLSATAADPPAVGVKVRDGAIEWKACLERAGGLERWAPRGRLEPPLEGAAVRRALLPALGLDARVLGALPDRLGIDDLLARLAAAGIAVVAVGKRRRLFERGALRAEHTQIHLLGQALETVALESTNPAAVAEARRTFGLADRENESYPALLRRLCGPAAGRPPEDPGPGLRRGR